MTWDISRRMFLKAGSLAAVGVGFSPSTLLVRAAEGAEAGTRVLVQVFLRGAADGLSLCVPHGESAYYDLRRTIALGRPGTTGGVINLDGFFGMHPAMSALKPIYDDGRLAFVQAVGNYDQTRSHFEAQDFMDTGSPGAKTTSTGWLDRSIAAIPGSDVMQAAAFATQRPRSFLGPEPVLVAQSVTTFDLRATNWRAEAERQLRVMYDARTDEVGKVGRDTFTAVSTLLATPAVRAAPANGAVYPVSTVGNGLRQAAALIKANLGTRCIYVNVPGAFDTHSGQLLANQLEFGRLGDALAAFDQDLGRGMDDVVVLVTTEFGRVAFENGSQGTDHGSGHCEIVMGGGVRGGRVLGRWPGLSRSQLYQERDLAVTTDYRDVFAEVARAQLGVDTSRLFPDYSPGAALGVVR